MEKKLSEFRVLVNEILRNPFTVELGQVYRNNIDLSGFVLRKPRFYKSDKKGTESCSFMLYQIIANSYGLKVESYNCITYVKELVEQMKVQKNVFFVATVGKFRHSFKIETNYSQVLEMKTIMEFEQELVD